MIVPSFLFLFYLLVSVFTCKIQNLLLGTGKALLFPDKLSYVINVDSLFFTHPRRLPRPIVLENSSLIVQAHVSSPLLRSSQRLQSRASSSENHTSVLPPTFSTPTSLPPCSDTARKSLMTSKGSNTSQNGNGLLRLPLPPSPRPSSSSARQISVSRTISNESNEIPRPEQPRFLVCQHTLGVLLNRPLFRARRPRGHGYYCRVLLLPGPPLTPIPCLSHRGPPLHHCWGNPQRQHPSTNPIRLVFPWLRSGFLRRSCLPRRLILGLPSCGLPGCATSYSLEPTSCALHLPIRFDSASHAIAIVDRRPTAPPAIEYLPHDTVVRQTGIQCLSG